MKLRILLSLIALSFVGGFVGCSDSPPLVDDSLPVVDDSLPVVDDSLPVVDDSLPVVDDSSVARDIPVVHDISQDELLNNPPAGALILDVRTPDEYARGHVPNAVLVPHDELAGRVAELGTETGTPIVVYCESGKRAGMATATLLEAGFTKVLHLDGDMRGWRASDRPTAQ